MIYKNNIKNLQNITLPNLIKEIIQYQIQGQSQWKSVTINWATCNSKKIWFTGQYVKNLRSKVLYMRSVFHTIGEIYFPYLYRIWKSSIVTTKKIKEKPVYLFPANTKASLSKTSTEDIASTFQNCRLENKLLKEKMKFNHQL